MQEHAYIANMKVGDTASDGSIIGTLNTELFLESEDDAYARLLVEANYREYKNFMKRPAIGNLRHIFVW